MILQTNWTSAQNWPFPCSQRPTNVAQPPIISSTHAVRSGTFDKKSRRLKEVIFFFKHVRMIPGLWLFEMTYSKSSIII